MTLLRIVYQVSALHGLVTHVGRRVGHLAVCHDPLGVATWPDGSLRHPTVRRVWTIDHPRSHARVLYALSEAHADDLAKQISDAVPGLGDVTTQAGLHAALGPMFPWLHYAVDVERCATFAVWTRQRPN